MKISVIIPCQTKADLCPELKPALKTQTLQAAEILIITDKIFPGSPGKKRDFGAQKAKGEVFAFIDADAYPDQDWLKNAAQRLLPQDIGAVCGPGVTPPHDSPEQKLSGLFWSMTVGAGSYVYRSRPKKERLVDDYPTFNLLVKRTVFLEAGGFDIDLWPGEDTKLCLAITKKLNLKILYSPDVLVHHHRKAWPKQHLAQVARYGFQRGRFVRMFPETSLRFKYFLFPLWLLSLPLTWPLYLLIICWVAIKKKKLKLIWVVPKTHLTYTLAFLKGLISS